jgi:hypothetical protein
MGTIAKTAMCEITELFKLRKIGFFIFSLLIMEIAINHAVSNLIYAQRVIIILEMVESLCVKLVQSHG